MFNVKMFIKDNPELTKKIGIAVGALVGVTATVVLLYRSGITVEPIETLEAFAE